MCAGDNDGRYAIEIVPGFNEDNDILALAI
jgi:hypothetical protein